jgi:transposase
MGKLKRMDQVKYILEAYTETRSIKGTARRLQVSKNTVRDYVRRVRTHFKDLSKALELTNEELYRLCYPPDTNAGSSRECDFNKQINYWIVELRRVGVTRKLLWEEYRQTHEQGFGYSQYCERLNREIGRRDLTIKMNHTPGEKMQVDFAGKTMSWVTASNGEVHECQILIATMPHTQHSFVIALPSQSTIDFIHGLNQALLFFGRLPKVILSDNLKAFVIRANKYEPDFNELCIQLAAHYQIDLEATRVRKPKDKASVENLVSTIYTRIYAPLRNEIFHSLEELNEGIKRQLKDHNQRPYQQKPGCRLSEYQAYEYPVMKDLPADLFEIKRSTQSKVRRDYHVYIGEEKNYYSVPFQYVARQSTVVYTSTTVEVFIDHQRVATHARLFYRNLNRYQTNPDHMPKSHLEWKKARGFNAAYYIGQAEKIGPATSWAIQFIIRSAIHPPQSFNSCVGVLKFSEKYSSERLENTCVRCQKVGKATYRMIKSILAKNLDLQIEPADLFTTPAHDNIRGPEAYQ